MKHGLETLYKSRHHTTVQFKKEEKNNKDMQTQYELEHRGDSGTANRKLIK